MSAKELVYTLKVLASATCKRNTLAILANVLVEAIAPDKLRLTICNCETAQFHLRRTIKGVEVYEAGSTTVNLAELRSILPTPKACPFITIQNEGEAQPFTLHGVDSHVRIDSLPASEFPPFPADLDTTTATRIADLGKLRTALAATLPATSTDQARPLLTAIHGHKTYLEAADGYRLHRYDTGHTLPDFLLNAKLAKALLMSTAESGWIESKDEHFYYADSDGWKASADMSWFGKSYPDLEQVIPRAHCSTVTIAKDQLDTWLDALDKISKAHSYQLMRYTIGSENEHVGMVHLATNEKKLDINVPATIQLGSPSVDRHFGFNPRYMKDMLACAGKDAAVTLEFSVSTTPVTARNGNGYTGVLMPMYIA